MNAEQSGKTVFINSGNFYPNVSFPDGSVTCLTKRLVADEAWQSYVVGGITADGKSLWEDVHTLNGLVGKYKGLRKTGAANVFIAEILN